MVPCMLGTSIQYKRLLVGTVILVLSQL
uniref:Uncharacterized protein n=1 Tax=Arundo donax TaxID=35708 RepID=A0A0A9DY23_ARUDO